MFNFWKLEKFISTRKDFSCLDTKFLELRLGLELDWDWDWG